MKSANAPVSASELNADVTCARVWCARYRTDLWPENRGGKHFAVGTKFHKVCETYARTGEVPAENTPIGQMFLAALPYLPAPRTFRQLEDRETFQVNGVPYLVIPDWAGPRAGVDEVLDFKTTKDLYGKDRETGETHALTTKAQKLADPQTVMYAYKYLPNGGNFTHLYVLKHRAVLIEYEDADPETCAAPIRPNAMPATVYLTRTEIEEAFSAVVHPRAQKLYTLRNKYTRIDPLSLDRTETSCEKYKNRKTGLGACAHLDRCFPQGKSPFSALGSTEVVMSFQFKIVAEAAPAAVADKAVVVYEDGTVAGAAPAVQPVKVFPWQKPSLPAQIAEAAKKHTVAQDLVQQLVQTPTPHTEATNQIEAGRQEMIKAMQEGRFVERLAVNNVLERLEPSMPAASDVVADIASQMTQAILPPAPDAPIALDAFLSGSEMSTPPKYESAPQPETKLAENAGELAALGARIARLEETIRKIREALA